LDRSTPQRPCAPPLPSIDSGRRSREGLLVWLRGGHHWASVVEEEMFFFYVCGGWKRERLLSFGRDFGCKGV